VYVSDSFNNRVRNDQCRGIIRQLAGTVREGSAADGVRRLRLRRTPRALARQTGTSTSANDPQRLSRLMARVRVVTPAGRSSELSPETGIRASGRRHSGGVFASRPRDSRRAQGNLSSRTTRPGECARSLARDHHDRGRHGRCGLPRRRRAGRPARVEPSMWLRTPGQLYITDYTRVRKGHRGWDHQHHRGGGPETAAPAYKARLEHVSGCHLDSGAACTSPGRGTPRAQRHTGWQDSHGRRNADCGLRGDEVLATDAPPHKRAAWQ